MNDLQQQQQKERKGKDQEMLMMVEGSDVTNRNDNNNKSSSSSSNVKVGNGSKKDGGGEKLPPGFRFHPTDEELITYYLVKKIADAGFTGRAVADVDLNKSEPWDLPGKAKMGEKEWYFFSQRDRKYPTGVRTNRATNTGYWKTTGKDKEIYNGVTSELVGMKKTLVFYRGRAPRGEKSNWVMHEYRIHSKSSYRPSKQDEWVICRVFQKTTGSSPKHNNSNKYPSSSLTINHHHQSRPPMTSSLNNPYTSLHEMIAGVGPTNAAAAFLPPPPTMINHQFPPHHDDYHHFGQRPTYNNTMTNSELADLARAFRASTATHQQMMMNNNGYQSTSAGGGCFTLSGLSLNLGATNNNNNVGLTAAVLPPTVPFSNQQLVEQQEENVGASSSIMMSPPFPGLTDEGSGYGGGGNAEQSMDFDAYCWASY
ncbi:unnamed protein product [Linum trigynum]|uniref:NAC domain-containing protein n=1 Tax=Linum trigynum TaxID=586398 RepID=A0AAV2C903_9ROSI